MLSLERTKELLNDPTLSDKEIQEIRDGFYLLAEIIFGKWQEEKRTDKLNDLKRPPLNETESANMPPECRKKKRNPRLYFNGQER
ncbi:MAG: hypothetical protein Q8N22_00470 [bacterium]|nr:hypothetical protein [bacterium]